MCTADRPMANRVSGMKLNIFSHPHSTATFFCTLLRRGRRPMEIPISVVYRDFSTLRCMRVCVCFDRARDVQSWSKNSYLESFIQCFLPAWHSRCCVCVLNAFFLPSNATQRTPLTVREFIFRFFFIFSFMQIYCLLALCVHIVCICLAWAPQTKLNWHIRSDLPKCLFRLDKGIFIFFSLYFSHEENQNK